MVGVVWSREKEEAVMSEANREMIRFRAKRRVEDCWL